MRNLIRKILISLGLLKAWNPGQKSSYSQTGEDLIIWFVCEVIGIEKPSYLDIGAHHPFKMSNTALFYEKGCRGVNVEANPLKHMKFITCRKEDINLNIGIADKAGILDFYVMSDDKLSTFSEKESKELVAKGYCTICEVLRINTLTINQVISEHCSDKCPDILSVDTEGIDFEIVSSLDFSKHSPAVICIETISYSLEGKGEKNKAIIEFLESKGYFLFADTYINSIFVKENLWRK